MVNPDAPTIPLERRVGLLGKVKSSIKGGAEKAIRGIDRTIDSAAFFLGANAVVGFGVYHASGTIDDVTGWHEDTYTRLPIMAVAYGLANWKLILPATKKIFQRAAGPSWLNQGKMWALAGLTAFTLNYGNFGADVNRVHDEFKKSTWQGASSQKTWGTLEKYATGEKVNDIILNIQDAWKRNFEGHKSCDPQNVKCEMQRVRNDKPNRDFLYFTDSVSQAALEMKRKGIPMTAEQARGLMAVLYFEGAYDANAPTSTDVKRNFDAIAFTFLNRHHFAKSNPKMPMFTRPKEITPYDVGFKYNILKDGTTVWEFTAVGKNPRYLVANQGKNGWDIYRNAKINVQIGDMDQRKSQIAQQALIDVFTGKIKKDPTDGALFYKNDKYADEHNNNWGKRYGVQKGVRIGSHDFWVPNPSAPNWKGYDIKSYKVLTEKHIK